MCIGEKFVSFKHSPWFLVRTVCWACIVARRKLLHYSLKYFIPRNICLSPSLQPGSPPHKLMFAMLELREERGGRGEQCVRVAKFSKFSRRAVAGGQLRQQDQVPRSRCQAVAECAGGRKVGQLVQQSILYTVQYCTHVSTFLQLQFIIKIFLTHYIQENSVVKSLL